MSKVFFGLLGMLCVAALILLGTRLGESGGKAGRGPESATSRGEPQPKGSARTDLAALVTAYENSLPGQDSNAFVQPGGADLTRFQEAVRVAQKGDLSAANEQLAPLSYEAANFQDAASGGEHVVLRERAPCQRCWGLYILNRSPAARDIVIEVPHPLWDQFTPEMGIEAYRRLEARAFLMAGAHRYANGRDSLVSDMARNPRSVFQAIHELLIDRDSQILQYHGFDESDRRGYPDVVLSDGSSTPHPGLFALKSAIEARGAKAGVYDGRLFADLGATDNPQGQQSRAIGARFYHMEHDYAIRKEPDRRSAMIDAAYAALIAGPGR